VDLSYIDRDGILMKMLVIVLEDLGAFQHRTNLEHLSWNGIHHSLSYVVLDDPRLQLVTTELDRLGGAVLMHR